MTFQKKKNVSHRINYLSWRSPGESHKLSHIIAGVCSGVEWTHCLFPGGFSWSTSNTKSVLKRRGRQPLKRTEHWYHLFRVDQAPSASNVPNLTCFLPLEENSKQIDWWQSNWTYPEHVTNQVDSLTAFSIFFTLASFIAFHILSVLLLVVATSNQWCTHDIHFVQLHASTGDHSPSNETVDPSLMYKHVRQCRNQASRFGHSTQPLALL